MGLDNYAVRDPEGILTEEDEKAFIDAGIELCGGLMSDGVSSFRGKIYAIFIEHVTGISLYRERIPPEIVRKMADILNS